MRRVFGYSAGQGRKSFAFMVKLPARQTLRYSVPQGYRSFAFKITSAVRHTFRYGTVRGRKRYGFKVKGEGLRYRFSYPVSGPKGRWRLRYDCFGEIFHELPPPAFMMPVHEALFESICTAFLPPEHESIRDRLPYALKAPPGFRQLSKPGFTYAAAPADFYDAQRPDDSYTFTAEHIHSAVFENSEYILGGGKRAALTAAAMLLSLYYTREIDPDGGVLLDARDELCAITGGGEELESIVPEAFIAGGEETYSPLYSRGGLADSMTEFLENPPENAFEILLKTLSRRETRQAAKEPDELIARREREKDAILLAMLYLLCREDLKDGAAAGEITGTRVGISDAFLDSPERVFIKSLKYGDAEQWLSMAERFVDKGFVKLPEHAARRERTYGAALELLHAALCKTEKDGAVYPDEHEYCEKGEKPALIQQIIRYLKRFTERPGITGSERTALRVKLRETIRELPEQAAVQLEQEGFVPAEPAPQTLIRLKEALRTAEIMLAAERSGLVDMENERELTLFKRLWFIRGDGETDRVILPCHDYNYSDNPLVFEGFDDLIPENRSVVYPETLRRGISRHPIPGGAKLGTREIPVAVSIMVELINVLILMWSRFYRAFWGWTGVQAVLGITGEVCAWLTLESSRAQQDERESREDYDRCFRWLRWEAEKTAIAARNDMELRGNYYVGLLIEELIGYMIDHHFDVMPIFDDVMKMDRWRGLFGREAESDMEWTLDKVKGIRHKIITQKGRDNV